MLPALLVLCLPQPPHATHARVPTPLASANLPGWTALVTERYPQKGLNTIALCNNHVCSPNAAHVHALRPSCNQTMHTQCFHSHLRSGTQVEGRPRSPNALHTHGGLATFGVRTGVHSMGRQALCTPGALSLALRPPSPARPSPDRPSPAQFG